MLFRSRPYNSQLLAGTWYLAGGGLVIFRGSGSTGASEKSPPKIVHLFPQAFLHVLACFSVYFPPQRRTGSAPGPWLRTGPGAFAGRCGRKKTLKYAKTFKKACGKRCTIFGGDFSTAPVLPEPLNKMKIGRASCRERVSSPV